MDDDAPPDDAGCESTPLVPPVPMSRACSGRAAGERAMLSAMLLDAVQCLEGQGCPKRERQRLQAQARAWVMGRDAEVPFGFDNVCAYLGLPADRLRDSLLRLAARARHQAGARIRTNASAAEIRARAGRNANIRSLRAAGLSPRELAERFGLSYESILAICAPRRAAGHAAA